ncbi:4-amino-4-deoxy-L-arabinose transferase-like glycosyltransferase [Hydrogenivirga caldilitoris]|uniref:4-amino-4-deoxy-L-arabinose transferase-like glycosyltransferase n=1 Tax=Hydrogenivirga caldilitoris TaxID=246264 RepID=A0A497XQB1_9AQUI|nr:glycosyltransferase family 39 protein [Hydrogenivirga caldilitoris]RLJ70319.1 4-amino-4-deoxy-L-arabinose transferase-like glycosyltransferase [Hydrogenivirga caldilitoris]
MSPFTLAVLINLLFMLFRLAYIILYPIDLSPEEAQYWDWSRHLDLSYYSKPPMVAYLNFLSTSVFGNTELGVRITPVILSFVMSVLLYIFVNKLFNERVALLSSVIPNLFVGTAINSVLMTTDAPLVFFWGVTVMLIYMAVERNTAALWFWVGVFAGLAFLSKYPAVFLFPLTLLYLFLVNRELLLSTNPYISLIPAFTLSLPVLVWNIKHNFISFRHVSALAEKNAHFPNLGTFFEFIGGQVLLLSVFPFFFMVYGWWKTFRERDSRLVFLTVYSLPVFIFFSSLALKKKVYANWAGFGYFTGAVLAALFMDKLLKRSKPIFIGVVTLSGSLIILLHFTPLIDYVGLRKLLPPKRDPARVMIGWEELGREVGKFYTGKELVFSSSYQIAAELAFYVEGNPRTFVFHLGRMTQYYLWRDRLKTYKGRDALFISDWGLPDRVKKHFKNYEFLKSVDIFWRGEKVKSYKIYRMTNFTGWFDESPKGY